MWPGPYGDWGSRKYLLGEPGPEPRADGAGLRRHLLSHRPDPDTPLEETMGALATACAGQGAVRRYLVLPAGPDARGVDDAAALGDPLLIHQPKYSMLCARSKAGCSTRSQAGVGCIVFSPLAQGLLTDRYLNGVPEGSRAAKTAWRSSTRTGDGGGAGGSAAYERDRQARGQSWRRWRWPGRCAIRGHVDGDRGEPAGAGEGGVRGARAPQFSARSWRRSTGSRKRAA